MYPFGTHHSHMSPQPPTASTGNCLPKGILWPLEYARLIFKAGHKRHENNALEVACNQRQMGVGG